MIAVRLSPELEARLDRLARETRRSKSYYVKEAIAQYLNAREDTLLALSRLEDEEGRLLRTEVLWKEPESGKARTGRSPEHGAQPGSAAFSPPASSHAPIDRRSLAMHRAIAEKLRKNPRLLEKAKDNIRRWRRQGVDVHAFTEWEAILAKGVRETIRFMRSESEEAIRLRHSTPFTGILSPRERRKFFAKKPA